MTPYGMAAPRSVVVVWEPVTVSGGAGVGAGASTGGTTGGTPRPKAVPPPLPPAASAQRPSTPALGADTTASHQQQPAAVAAGRAGEASPAPSLFATDPQQQQQAADLSDDGELPPEEGGKRCCVRVWMLHCSFTPKPPNVTHTVPPQHLAIAGTEPWESPCTCCCIQVRRWRWM